MTSLNVVGAAKYVDVTPGYVLINGIVLYVNQTFRIDDTQLVGAVGGGSPTDFGDYYVHIKPNHNIMEAYYTKNWDYVIKGTSAGGAAPTVNADEFVIGRIEKRLVSGDTQLNAVLLNRGKHLIDTKDISDAAVDTTQLRDNSVSGAKLQAGVVTYDKIGAFFGGANLFSNTGFEDGTLNVNGGTLTSYQSTLANVTAPGSPRYGSKCIQLTSTVAGGGIQLINDSEKINVAVGEYYSYSCWVYSSTVGRSVDVGPRLFDASNNFVSQGGGTTTTSTVAGWTRINSGRIQIPTGVAKIGWVITFANCANGEVHYVDNVQVERGDITHAYRPLVQDDRAPDYHKITFDRDSTINLYRNVIVSGPTQLVTDNYFQAADIGSSSYVRANETGWTAGVNSVIIGYRGDTSVAAPAISFGSPYDCVFHRTGTNQLAQEGSLDVVGSLTEASGRIVKSPNHTTESSPASTYMNKVVKCYGPFQASSGTISGTGTQATYSLTHNLNLSGTIIVSGSLTDGFWSNHFSWRTGTLSANAISIVFEIIAPNTLVVTNVSALVNFHIFTYS